MSGSRRRTVYRKTVQDDTLHGFAEPSLEQCLAVVLASPGSNLFTVVTEDGIQGVALLRSHFRLLGWVKRGDCVILSHSDGATVTARGTAGAVSFLLEHILYPEAVNHLRSIGRWKVRLDAEHATVLECGGCGAIALEGNP